MAPIARRSRTGAVLYLFAVAARGVPEHVRGSAGSAPRLPAAPVREPEGITRRVLLNLFEAFFRRPWLYLLPVVLLLAFGATSALSVEKEFRSVGTIRATTSADQTLSELTAAAQTPGFSFESPASIESRQITQSLRTREFLAKVAEAANIEGAANVDALIQLIGPSLFAFADGDNLVRVGATTDNPEASQRLAAAVIETYIREVVEAETSVPQAAIDINTRELAAAVEARDEAQRELDRVIAEQGNATAASRTTRQEVDFTFAVGARDRAQLKVDEVQTKLDLAESQRNEAETVVGQRLRVVDPPEVPVAEESRLMDAIFTVALFGVLGLIVGLGLLVLTAALDRTVRVPNDITTMLGTDVLAVVPNVGR